MGDYPTNAELKRIREWSYDDPAGWMGYIHGCWHFAERGWHEEDGTDILDRPVRRYNISTGGWSGNEDIIDAMRDNMMLWLDTWYAQRRGGHWTFEVRAARTAKVGSA